MCSGTPRPAKMQRAMKGGEPFVTDSKYRAAPDFAITHKENNGTPVQSQSERDKTVAGNEGGSGRPSEGWNSRGVSSLLTVWRLPIAFRGVEDKLKCSYHISQTKGGHKNRDIDNILPTLNTSFCLAAYIGRTNLPESRWEVKHNGKNY